MMGWLKRWRLRWLEARALAAHERMTLGVLATDDMRDLAQWREWERLASMLPRDRADAVVAEVMRRVDLASWRYAHGWNPPPGTRWEQAWIVGPNNETLPRVLAVREDAPREVPS